MKFIPVARSAAASAMLALVLMASLLGTACEARCIHPSTTHTCCPMLDENSHARASIADMAVCHNLAVLPADLIAPAGLVAGLAVFTSVEPAIYCAASETPTALVTVSPPKFNLRI